MIPKAKWGQPKQIAAPAKKTNAERYAEQPRLPYPTVMGYEDIKVRRCWPIPTKPGEKQKFGYGKVSVKTIKHFSQFIK